MRGRPHLVLVEEVLESIADLRRHGLVRVIIGSACIMQHKLLHLQSAREVVVPAKSCMGAADLKSLLSAYIMRCWPTISHGVSVRFTAARSAAMNLRMSRSRGDRESSTGVVVSAAPIGLNLPQRACMDSAELAETTEALTGLGQLGQEQPRADIGRSCTASHAGGHGSSGHQRGSKRTHAARSRAGRESCK